MQTFKTIKNTIEYQNDNGCCAVVAHAVAFDTDIKTIQSYYDKRGRKRNRGTANTTITIALRDMARERGHEIKVLFPGDIKRITRGATMTVNNCTRYLDKNKNYVMLTRGHAVGVSGGRVEDWSAGSKRPVKMLYELTPPKREQEEKQEEKVNKLTNLENYLNNL